MLESLEWFERWIEYLSELVLRIDRGGLVECATLWFDLGGIESLGDGICKSKLMLLRRGSPLSLVTVEFRIHTRKKINWKQLE